MTAILIVSLSLRTAIAMQEAGSPPKYRGSWVEKLNQEGFSVCGIDQQGCGFSEGLECYVERFDHYVDDVLQFARSVPVLAPPGMCEPLLLFPQV